LIVFVGSFISFVTIVSIVSNGKDRYISVILIVMDQTSRPLNISPEFLLYAEKHALFELFQVKNN
jgi:hypothetical protein